MDRKKGEGITGVWQDWGFGLTLKLVLYFQSQCLTESLGFLNPQPRQAPGRCASAWRTEIENIKYYGNN